MIHLLKRQRFAGKSPIQAFVVKVGTLRHVKHAVQFLPHPSMTSVLTEVLHTLQGWDQFYAIRDDLHVDANLVAEIG